MTLHRLCPHPFGIISEIWVLLVVRVWAWDTGQLLREPGRGGMREDDEPCLLGQVQTPDSLKDFPRHDTAPPRRCPGLRHTDPDSHQMAVGPNTSHPGLACTEPTGSICELRLFAFSFLEQKTDQSPP